MSARMPAETATTAAADSTATRSHQRDRAYPPPSCSAFQGRIGSSECIAATLYGVPHVVTMHSLEPMRPWKAEQLGGGYALSRWCERVAVESAAAVVAVSAGMRADILATYPAVTGDRVRVVHNGIDTSEYAPDPQTDVLERYGVDRRRPCVVFVGRITRQKGLPVLLRAAAKLAGQAQLVLCAGQPDTAELAAEVTDLVTGLQARRSGVVWLSGMLPKREVIQLPTHATVFACPSLYKQIGSESSR